MYKRQVFIQGVHAQLLDRPQILLDDCRGAYLATRYLIELGHRRIVGVFKSDDTQGQQRHKGYVQALQEEMCIRDRLRTS